MTSEVLIVCAHWIPMGAWEIRVDHSHQANGHEHVHVRRKRGRKGEFSWNSDGTRHDKHKFPVSEGMIGKAKEIAANQLNIPISSLDFLTSLPDGRVTISQSGPAADEITRVYCKVESIILLSENWITIVASKEAVDLQMSQSFQSEE